MPLPIAASSERIPSSGVGDPRVSYSLLAFAIPFAAAFLLDDLPVGNPTTAFPTGLAACTLVIPGAIAWGSGGVIVPLGSGLCGNAFGLTYVCHYV